jgi:glutamine synthetase
LNKGYTAGKAKASLKDYDIRKLTFRQAIDFFLNAKNNTDSEGDKFTLNTKWNDKGSSISYGSFKNYRNYRNEVVEWMKTNNLDGIRLIEINKTTAYHFFEHFRRKQRIV